MFIFSIPDVVRMAEEIEAPADIQTDQQDNDLQPSDGSDTDIVDREEAFLPWDQAIEESDDEFEHEVEIVRTRPQRGVRRTDRVYLDAAETIELMDLFRNFELEVRTPTIQEVRAKLEVSKKTGGKL